MILRHCFPEKDDEEFEFQPLEMLEEKEDDRKDSEENDSIQEEDQFEFEDIMRECDVHGLGHAAGQAFLTFQADSSSGT